MRIFKHNEDHYTLKRNTKQVTGNKAVIIAHMLLLGVSESEIHLGLSELEVPGINVAEYGFGFSGNGPCFIYAIRLAS